MKRNWILALAILLVLFASLSHAAIRRVGLNQTYTTLTAAYTAAVNDDTLLISPGVYSETITSTKRLTWLGAGYDEVTVNGRLILNAGSSGTRVEGLHLNYAYDGGGGLLALASGISLINIKRCIIHNLAETTYGSSNYARCVERVASPGGALNVESCVFIHHSTDYNSYALALLGDEATVRNCLFAFHGPASNAYPAIYGTPTSVLMENNVFLGYPLIFNTTGAFTLVFKNNIAHDWIGTSYWGFYPGGGTGWSYNASSTIAPPGTDGILLAGDPFVNYDETANYIYGSSNLHFNAGSPCIDAGNPAILDLDNSRSDMGIYGGPTPHVDGGAPNYPFAIDLTIPANMSAGQQLPIQATGRIGAGY